MLSGKKILVTGPAGKIAFPIALAGAIERGMGHRALRETPINAANGASGHRDPPGSSGERRLRRRAARLHASQN